MYHEFSVIELPSAAASEHSGKVIPVSDRRGCWNAIFSPSELMMSKRFLSTA